MEDDGQRLLAVPMAGPGTVREYLADTLYEQWMNGREVDWDAWEQPLAAAFAKVSRDSPEDLIALAIEALKGPLVPADPVSGPYPVEWR